MEKEDILSKLNNEQQEAVLAVDGPVLILAGAGSGKTRVLVHRIAYMIDVLGVAPGNILAITFTNKAADEMRTRVDNMIGFGSREIWVSTFHSLCVRILRQNADLMGYTRYFSIYDTDDQLSLMKTIFHERNIDREKVKEKGVLGRISKAKDELIAPDKYLAQNKDTFSQMVGDLYSIYQRKLKENNAMDFDDLIMKTVELFETHPEVLAMYQDRFRYMMVDEYQDTNTAQFRFVSLLAGKYKNLCVVGDDDQSIYKFRGANIRNILGFEKIFPDARVIKLERNYRSTKNILNAANEVIRRNHGRKAKKLWTDSAEGAKVRLRRFDTGFAEAEFVANEISLAVRRRERRYSDFAVLYRTNAQSRLFEEKMLFANIPYRIVGGVNFYARKEIKDLLAYLKTIDNGQDDLQVQRIINVPKRGIGATTISKLNTWAEYENMSFLEAASQAAKIPSMSASAAKKVTGFTDFIGTLRAKAEGASVSEILKAVIEDTGYVDALKKEHTEEADSRIENIDELLSKAVQYESSAEEPTLSGFLEEVALIADIDDVEEGDDRVLLMTLHAAKGLEFPVVYMAGMEEGLFPSAMSINAERPEEEIEEERRLCYVGITRAKEELTFTCARQRMIRGDVISVNLSRFVEEIPREMVDVGEDDYDFGYGASDYGYDTSDYGYGASAYSRSGRYPYGAGTASGRYSYGAGTTSGRNYRSGGGKDGACSGFNSAANQSSYRAGTGHSSGSGLNSDMRSAILGEPDYGGSPYRSSGNGGRTNTSAGNTGRTKASSDKSGRASTSADYNLKNPYKKASVPKDPGTNPSELSVGDMVRHVKFGDGTILKIESSGKGPVVTADFPGWGTKRLVAAYAHLTKL